MIYAGFTAFLLCISVKLRRRLYSLCRLHRLSVLYFSQALKEADFTIFLLCISFKLRRRLYSLCRLHHLSVLYFSQASKEADFTTFLLCISVKLRRRLYSLYRLHRLSVFYFSQASKETVFFMLALPPFCFVFQSSFERALYFSQASKETVFFMPALPPFCFVFKSSFEGGRIHSLSAFYFSQVRRRPTSPLFCFEFSLTSKGTVCRFQLRGGSEELKCVDPHVLCFTSTSALLDFVYCLFSFIPALCFSQTLKETVFFTPISPPRGVGGA